MHKKSFFALLLVTMLVLSGCSLVIKDQTIDNGRVIIDVDGEQIKKANILYAYQQSFYNAQLNAQMYEQYLGYSQPVDEAAVLQSTLDEAVTYLVTKHKAASLGYDQFSAEELTNLDATAATEYQKTLESYKSNYFRDSKLEGEALEAQVKEYASNNGYTLDTALTTAKNTMTMDKLKKSVTDLVTLTDEDLQAALDAKIEEEKTSYESSLSAYGSTVNSGTAAYYTPAGYRYVKQILVKLTEADSTAVNEAKTSLTTAQSELTDLNTKLAEAETAATAEGVTEELKATLTEQAAALKEQIKAAQASVYALASDKNNKEKTAYASIEQKANDIYSRAAAGEDFDLLVKEFNEDPGMPENGYAICADFENFDTSFTSAAMSLDTIGGIAEPAKGIYGFYIIKYTGDIPEGAATLDTARATLTDETLKTKQDDAYTAAVAAWTEEADVKVYSDRIAD